MYSSLRDKQIFGDIQETTANRSKRPNTSKSIFRPKLDYASNVTTLNIPVTSNLSNIVNFPCLSCDDAHSQEHCSYFQRKTQREKLNFLKEKGCLCKGHISKDCKVRLSCKICNRTHPSVLHINFQVKGETSRSAESPRIKEVSSNICGHNGARNTTCALSVKGNKIIHTYALLDPESTRKGALCGKNPYRMGD